MRFLPLALVSALLGGAPAGPAAAQPGAALYTVTFESTWSAETHPADFPADAHFSSLVGATHGAGASLWEPGGLASPGIEEMAETGRTTLLDAEVDALIAAGTAGARLNGGNLPVSPGAVALTFEIAPDFPLVSLVTMVAPSPDWFVGVHGLSLRDGGGAWVPALTVELFAYDAGTDSGASYASADADTQPREPIARIAGYPFAVEGAVRPVGTYTFVLNGTAAGEDGGEAAAALLGAPAPNPFGRLSTLTLRVPAAERVRVEAFDALGRRVAVLHDGLLGAGAAQRLTLDGAGLPAGAYVVRATGETFVQSRRVTLVR